MAYRIMIVEDEYWNAMEMATEVEDRGGIVTGPLGSLSEAMDLLHGPERPDAAILDVNLRGADILPFADMLLRRKIPFVFATGYDKAILPERFARVPHFEKPITLKDCVDTALALAAGHEAQKAP
ncbi:MAG: response regulator [Alphaproteobacteria bacterium]|nr:response regulator [Alphaproteobacteria bacterium]